MDTVTIKKRLEFHTRRLDNLYLAYNKLLSGGVKSYRLDDRELTRLDLGKLSDEIKDAEEKVDELLHFKIFRPCLNCQFCCLSISDAICPINQYANWTCCLIYSCCFCRIPTVIAS